MDMIHRRPSYKKLCPEQELDPELIKAIQHFDRQEKRFEYDIKHGAPVYRNASTGAITDSHDPNAILADYGPSCEISLDLLLEDVEKTFDYVIDDFSDPLEIVIKREQYCELHRCIDLLPLTERNLIIALFFMGMTETEYASWVGRSQSSVNERKHRAFAKIKAHFWKKDPIISSIRRLSI